MRVTLAPILVFVLMSAGAAGEARADWASTGDHPSYKLAVRSTPDSGALSWLRAGCTTGPNRGLSFVLEIIIDEELKGLLSSGYTNIAKIGNSVGYVSMFYSKPANYTVLVADDRGRDLYVDSRGSIDKDYPFLKPEEWLEITPDEAYRSGKYKLSFRFGAMYGSLEENFIAGTDRLNFRVIPLIYSTIKDAHGKVISASRLEWGYGPSISFEVANGELEIASLAAACKGN